MAHRGKRLCLMLMIVVMLLSVGMPALAGGAPEKVRVESKAAIGDGQVTITFYKNTAGLAPSVYQIHWWNNGPEEKNAAYLPYVEIPATAVTQDKHSRTFTNLKNGTIYYFKVYAVGTEHNYSERSEIISATPGKPSIDPRAEEVKRSYQEAFGREATAKEVESWLTTDAALWRTYSDLVNLHRETIKQAEGIRRTVISRAFLKANARDIYTEEQDEWMPLVKVTGNTYMELVSRFKERTVNQSIFDAFGREATAKEITDWTTYDADLWKSYEDLIRLHRATIKQAEGIRRTVIKRAFQRALGRDPYTEEVDRWLPQVASDGMLYKELVAKLGVARKDEELNIKRSYRDAFGREATDQEVASWKARRDWSTYADLIKKHRSTITSDEKVREDLLNRSYFAVYWRGPVEAGQVKEKSYWLGLIKQSGLTYLEVVGQHQKFLKQDKGMRDALIHNAFRTSLGRDASDAEYKLWTDQILKGNVFSYQQLIESLRSSLMTKADLRQEVIKLSYLGVFGRQPTTAEKSYWSNRIETSGENFSALVKVHRGFIKLDPAMRTEMITRSYQEVFKRKPDVAESTYWDGRLKQDGLVYEELLQAHKEWVRNNSDAIAKNAAAVAALAGNGLRLDTAGNVISTKTGAVIYKSGQYFFGTTDKAGKLTSLAGSSVIASGGLNVIAPGGGNIIASGGLNIIASGGLNVIAAGGGNVIAAGGGNIIASGGLNVIAPGGGNVIAAGGGNIIASGGLNVIAAGGGNLFAPGGSLIGQAGTNLIGQAGTNLIGQAGTNLIGEAGTNFSNLNPGALLLHPGY